LGENHVKAGRSPDFLRRSTGREQLCATFFTESRMEFRGSTNLYRKSRFGLHPLRNCSSSRSTLVTVKVLRSFGFILRRFWLGFLNISRSARGRTRYRPSHVGAFADLLALPASGTDILCSATGIATQYHPARQKQQEDRGSEHGFSFEAILS
jgi:hypothetical protein